MYYVRFLDDPYFKFVGNHIVELQSDFDVEIFHRGIEQKITIERKFISDGATVPRLLWFFVSPFDRGIFKAALLHDYISRSGSALKNEFTGEVFTVAETDELFYAAMLAYEYPKANLAFNAVNAFSFLAFNYKYKGLKPPIVRRVLDFLRLNPLR